MIGQKFGRLTILSEDFSVRPTGARCICDCGNYITVARADVVSGHTQSCGCLRLERITESNEKDFTDMVALSGVRLCKRAYKNSHGVWMWECECPLCGNSFVALPAKIMSNHTTSCGCSLMSSPERIIKSILDEYGVSYERQKRFADCKSKYTLPFDFALYDDKNEIMCLIEYDGAQHFRPVDFMGGDAGFQSTVERDAIKDRYCKEQNIPLYRFNYKQSTSEIKQILSSIINP